QLGSWEYDIVAPNYKCNMTDIMASLGLAQFKRYSENLQRRKEIIELYNTLLSELKVSSLIHYDNDYQSSGHLYLLNLIGKEEAFRNEVINKMAERGIATNVHYKPLPMHTAYKKIGFDIKNFPNAYETYKNQITLPLHTLLSNEDIEYIVCSLKEI